MKKLMKNILSVFMLCTMIISNSVISYAQTSVWERGENIKTPETVKEYVKAKEARTIAMPKGRLISSVEIRLVNAGSGVAEIYANELCHEAMAKIKMVLFLEKWNEEEEAWDMEERFEYEWLAEDTPDKDLSMAAVSFNVYGLDRGYKYRVRGLFGAYDLDSGLQEAWQAWTEDVYFD